MSMWSEPVSHDVFYICYNKSREIAGLCVTQYSKLGRIILKGSLI